MYTDAINHTCLSVCHHPHPHSTSAGYSLSLQARVPYLGTLSTARMVSTWGTSASAPSSAPLTCNAFPWTTCRSSSQRVHFYPLWQRAPSSSAILLIFQGDDQHEQITDVYIGLVVLCIESHLYAPEKILDFMSDIEVNLKVAHDALKAGCDLGKRHAFCLFVNKYGGVMSVPMDLPYCLIYPTSYVKDVEPNHFDTHNNPAGTHLHCYICHTTLQYMNEDPHYHRAYGGSHLILPHGAQYKEQLFSEILEPWNHQVLFIDPITKEPFPMKLMGDFRSMDPIFKGCYGDLLLYSDMDLG